MLQSDQSEPVISKIGFTPRLKTDVEHLQAGLGELLPVCHGENIWNGNILPALYRGPGFYRANSP